MIDCCPYQPSRNKRLGFEGCYDFFYLPMVTWQDLRLESSVWGAALWRDFHGHRMEVLLECRLLGFGHSSLEDMRNKNSVGYAFINFRDPASVSAC